MIKLQICTDEHRLFNEPEENRIGKMRNRIGRIHLKASGTQSSRVSEYCTL
jgi:hypothetical protein